VYDDLTDVIIMQITMIQRNTGTVHIEEYSGHRGTVGTEEQRNRGTEEQRNRGTEEQRNRGTEEQRNRGTVGTEEH